MAISNKKSHIKPHFINLSSSGHLLGGLIAERDIEQPKEEYRDLTVEPNKHILVLHNGKKNKLEWKLDGRKKKEEFRNGDLIINPAGLNTNPYWQEDVELLVLAIHPTFVQFVAEEIESPNELGIFPQFKFQDKYVNLLTRNLIQEFEKEEGPDLVYAESLQYGLVSHIIKKYSREGNSHSKISENGLPPIKLSLAIDYINVNIGNNLSLEGIAKVTGFSPSYFITLFKNATGLTPHQYIIRRRMEIAREQLTETKKSITEIALEAGFSDQSHLTRIMRQYTGLTPGKIRGK